MIARLIYLAHPVRPEDGETMIGNLRAAVEYRDELMRAGVLVVAPWVFSILQGCWPLSWDEDELLESEAIHREVALQCSERYAAACWAVALCGSRVSAGMEREATASGRAYDLTQHGPSVAAQLMLAYMGHRTTMTEAERTKYILGEWGPLLGKLADE